MENNEKFFPFYKEVNGIYHLQDVSDEVQIYTKFDGYGTDYYVTVCGRIIHTSSNLPVAEEIAGQEVMFFEALSKMSSMYDSIKVSYHFGPGYIRLLLVESVDENNKPYCQLNDSPVHFDGNEISYYDVLNLEGKVATKDGEMEFSDFRVWCESSMLTMFSLTSSHKLL